MREFVKSLKRLYQNNDISIEKINDLLENGKITKEEKFYILNAH